MSFLACNRPILLQKNFVVSIQIDEQFDGNNMNLVLEFFTTVPTIAATRMKTVSVQL